MKRLFALAIVSLAVQSTREAPRAPYSTWSEYRGSADSMQYSSLDRITTGNVSRLELAWFHPSPIERAASASTRSSSAT